MSQVEATCLLPSCEGKALNVLRVGDSIFHHAPGGWATARYYQSKELVSAFATANVPVRLCAFGRITKHASPLATPIDQAQLSPCGVHVRALGIWPVALNSLAATHALRAHIRDADVVWATLPTMLGLMAIEINNRKKPCVVQLVGDPRRAIAELSRKLSTKLISVVAANLVRRAITKADGAIFVSEALRTAYLSDASQRSLVANESRIDRTQVIGQGDLAGAHRASQEGHPSLVYVGRLSPEKGVTLVLRALAAVSQPNLTIIGNGPQRPELEVMTARLGIADRVHFLGSRPWGDELLELIRRHQALILPSLTEGLPLVLIEAMSQGVPVIASSVGGIPDLVQDGVTGLLFPRGDVAALAAAIRRVISSPGLRYELAREGLGVARSNTAEVQYGKAVNFLLDTVALRRTP